LAERISVAPSDPAPVSASVASSRPVIPPADPVSYTARRSGQFQQLRGVDAGKRAGEVEHGDLAARVGADDAFEPAAEQAQRQPIEEKSRRRRVDGRGQIAELVSAEPHARSRRLDDDVHRRRAGWLRAAGVGTGRRCERRADREQFVQIEPIRGEVERSIEVGHAVQDAAPRDHRRRGFHRQRVDVEPVAEHGGAEIEGEAGVRAAEAAVGHDDLPDVDGVGEQRADAGEDLDALEVQRLGLPDGDVPQIRGDVREQRGADGLDPDRLPQSRRKLLLDLRPHRGRRQHAIRGKVEGKRPGHQQPQADRHPFAHGESYAAFAGEIFRLAL
jgi:hypothetical protein